MSIPNSRAPSPNTIARYRKSVEVWNSFKNITLNYKDSRNTFSPYEYLQTSNSSDSKSIDFVIGYLRDQLYEYWRTNTDFTADQKLNITTFLLEFSLDCRKHDRGTQDSILAFEDIRIALEKYDREQQQQQQEPEPSAPASSETSLSATSQSTRAPSPSISDPQQQQVRKVTIVDPQAMSNNNNHFSDDDDDQQQIVPDLDLRWDKEDQNSQLAFQQRVDEECRRRYDLVGPFPIKVDFYWDKTDIIEWEGTVSVNDDGDLGVSFAPSNPRFSDVVPRHKGNSVLWMQFPQKVVWYDFVGLRGVVVTKKFSDTKAASNPSTNSKPSRVPSVQPVNRGNFNFTNSMPSASPPAQAGPLDNMRPPQMNGVNVTGMYQQQQQQQQPSSSRVGITSSPSMAMALPFNQTTGNFASIPKQQREDAMLFLAPVGQTPLQDANFPMWGEILAGQGKRTYGAVNAELDQYFRQNGVGQDWGINPAKPLQLNMRMIFANSLVLWANLENPGHVAPFENDGSENFNHFVFSNALRGFYLIKYNIAQAQLPEGKSLDAQKFWGTINGSSNSGVQQLIQYSTVNKSGGFAKRGGNSGGSGGKGKFVRFQKSRRPAGCPENRCWKCFEENGNKFDEKSVPWYDKCPLHHKSGNASATGKH